MSPEDLLKQKPLDEATSRYTDENKDDFKAKNFEEKYTIFLASPAPKESATKLRNRPGKGNSTCRYCGKKVWSRSKRKHEQLCPENPAFEGTNTQESAQKLERQSGLRCDKDPKGPKQTVMPFLFYLKEMKAEAKKMWPDLSHKQRVTLLSQQWNKLDNSDALKRKCFELTQQDRIRYSDQIRLYLKSHNVQHLPKAKKPRLSKGKVPADCPLEQENSQFQNPRKISLTPRPKSATEIYFSEHKYKYPDLTGLPKLDQLRKDYKALSSEEKEKYLNQARFLKKEHLKQALIEDIRDKENRNGEPRGMEGEKIQNLTHVSIRAEVDIAVEVNIEQKNIYLTAENDSVNSANQRSENAVEETLKNKEYTTIKDDNSPNKKSEVAMDCKALSTTKDDTSLSRVSEHLQEGTKDDTSLSRVSEHLQEGSLSFKVVMTPNQLDTTWKCTKCTFVNRQEKTVCEICDTPNQSGSTLACTVCTYINSHANRQCEICSNQLLNESTTTTNEDEPLFSLLSRIHRSEHAFFFSEYGILTAGDFKYLKPEDWKNVEAELKRAGFGRLREELKKMGVHLEI